MFRQVQINTNHTLIDYNHPQNIKSQKDHEAIIDMLSDYTQGKSHYSPTIIIAGGGNESRAAISNENGEEYLPQQVVDLVAPLLRAADGKCDIFLLVDYAGVNGFVDQLHSQLEGLLLNNKIYCLLACKEKARIFDLVLYFTTTFGVKNYKTIREKQNTLNHGNPSQTGIFSLAFDTSRKGEELTPLQTSTLKGFAGF